MLFHRVALSLVVVLSASVVQAQESVALIGGDQPLKPWSFNNGAEFKGATGSLTLDEDSAQLGKPTLKLTGDFTAGGAYVQCGRQFPDGGVDVRDLSMRIRNVGSDRLTLRLIDGGGQVHQIALQTEPTDEWQQVTLPLQRFFDDRGTAGAVGGITKYEYWGGAKDGRWHGPAKSIYILISPRGDKKVRMLWINDLTVTTRPRAVAGAEVATTVRLDEILEGMHEWRFTNGPEFPGAKGSLTVAPNEPVSGKSCLKLAGDFSGGGAYVAMVRDLSMLAAASDVPAIRLQVKSQHATGLGIQLVDATGQTHQRKGVKIMPDGEWHEVVLRPSEISGGEHWGGANDGKWHGPPKLLSISVTKNYVPSGSAPELLLADIRAEALLPVFAQPAAFKETFEDEKLPAGWRIEGTAGTETEFALQGKRSLVVGRILEQINEPASATGPSFPVSPGRWAVDLTASADLHSPDNSYFGNVELDCLDASGKSIEKLSILELFGKKPAQQVKKTVDMPSGAVAARFEIRLHKTYGRFVVDDLSASYLAPAAAKDDRIVRLVFGTAALGNLLLPGDSRRVTLTLETRKPLRDEQRQVTCVVRDYWGAEQTNPTTVQLGAPQRKDELYLYEGALDLTDAPLEEGRYYEVHAAVPQPGGDPFRNFTSLAVLPEAPAKQYSVDQVPFVSRNWDNRFPEYIRLTDRLGIRMVGIWGGWSSKPPYEPHAPTLELARELGLAWITSTPCATIERGQTDYTEEALREGVTNFLKKYGKERPLTINLGNEPHGKGDIVLRNVASYKTVYEAIKKFDPTITVVATAVEPNEEYFQAGYGNYCDVYDFHIYESPDSVRRTIGEYKELMKKYDVVHPIWSTELGLNSQGMTRHVVAAEVYRKFATFFAAGGERVSWFGLLYPDPDGKSYGSSGDAHNVFDSRYRRFAPRLDAVAYYHAVNSIAIKKFVAEKQYADGVSAFLFRDRDGRSLQVLWKDRGRTDVQVPLPGVGEVRIVRIDGSSKKLDAAQKGLTLSLDKDPLLLLYEGGEPMLPEQLAASSVSLTSLPATISRRNPTTLAAQLGKAPHDRVELIAPLRWTVATSPAGESTVAFAVAPPPQTSIREVELKLIVRDSAGRPRGELLYRAPAAD